MDYYRVAKPGQFPDKNEPIYPARIVLKHYLFRGLQASALAFPIWPIYSLYARKSMLRTFRSVFTAAPILGLSGSLAALTVKSAMRLTNDDVDSLALSICNNAEDAYLKRWSTYGALVGASVGSIIGKHGVISVLSGTSFGMGAVVLAYFMHKSTEKGWKEAIQYEKFLAAYNESPVASYVKKLGK